MSNDSNENKKGHHTTVIGPDMVALSKEQSNTAIVSALTTLVLSGKVGCDFKSVVALGIKVLALILFKTAVQDSSSFVDGFKFSNLKFFLFMVQRFKYKHTTYVFNKVNGKYMYEDTILSNDRMTTFLEQKGVSIGQPGTYYMGYMGHLIKVTSTDAQLTFIFPSISNVIRFMDTDVVFRHRELLLGNKTVKYRAVSTNSEGNIKLENEQFCFAFETPNYKHLESTIKTNFFVNNQLGFQSSPFAINFDGPPGTGKTTFGSYMAGKGLLKAVIVLNMVQSIKKTFSETLNILRTQLQTQLGKDKPSPKEDSILIIFDEVDKWLFGHLEHKIDVMRNECRKQTTDKDKNVESFVPLTTEQEKEKRVRMHQDFLDTLFKLLEGEILGQERQYVFIFNTNHFDRLFEGMDVRNDALRSRFQQYHFHMSKKADIIHYMNSITHNLQQSLNDLSPTDQKTYEKEIRGFCSSHQAQLDDLPDDIEISYRSLVMILRNCQFNIPKAIEQLKEEHQKKVLTGQILAGCEQADSSDLASK